MAEGAWPVIGRCAQQPWHGHPQTSGSHYFVPAPLTHLNDPGYEQSLPPIVESSVISSSISQMTVTNTCNAQILLAIIWILSVNLLWLALTLTLTCRVQLLEWAKQHTQGQGANLPLALQAMGCRKVPGDDATPDPSLALGREIQLCSREWADLYGTFLGCQTLYWSLVGSSLELQTTWGGDAGLGIYSRFLLLSF